VARAVDFDAEAQFRPVQVHLDLGVHARLRQAGFDHDGEEPVLGAAARAGAAGGVGGEGLLERGQVAAPGGAGHGRAGGLDVEALAVRGLVDHAGERRPVEHVGEVDERAGDRGDRDAAPARDVAGVEVSARVQPEALARPAVAGHDDVDPVDAAAPDCLQRGGREVAEGRAGAGGEHRGQPFALLRQPWVADGVDAAVSRVQAARAHALRDRGAAQPEPRQLRACDQTVLPGCEAHEGCLTFVRSWLTFVRHPLTVARPVPRFTTRS
jgi:hypothetical protein